MNHFVKYPGKSVAKLRLYPGKNVNSISFFHYNKFKKADEYTIATSCSGKNFVILNTTN